MFFDIDIINHMKSKKISIKLVRKPLYSFPEFCYISHNPFSGKKRYLSEIESTCVAALQDIVIRLVSNFRFLTQRFDLRE